MVTLILDFATRKQKIGVFSGRDSVEGSFLPGRGTSAAPVALLQRTISMLNVTPADVTRIILNQGPGSFTGVRVSFSLAAGLRLGSGATVIGVPFHDALAHAAAGRMGADWSGTLACALHALRGEVYFRRFQIAAGLVTPLDELELQPLDQIPELLAGMDLPIVGLDVPVARQTHWQSAELSTAQLLAAAEALGTGGEELPRPVYFRKSWARERKEA